MLFIWTNETRGYIYLDGTLVTNCEWLSLQNLELDAVGLFSTKSVSPADLPKKFDKCQDFFDYGRTYLSTGILMK